MKRVLFVDDEPNILQGLMRMLRGLRKEWDMQFAENGAAGLEILKSEAFDIVVSDMKMPGMDGADFLTQVKELYPDTIRIILSGHSETEAVMKSVGPTHQYLAKPCDADVLKHTVQKAYALKSLLESEKLKSLIAELDSIPSMPSLYKEIVAELQKPHSTLEKVGEIIACDIGMSAKILKIVNSAYFGLLRPVNSVPHAVAYLGLETLTTLVLGAQIFSEFEHANIPGFSIDSLWKHSIETGSLTRVIARAEGADKRCADDAFMAGTLHDVGTLVLAGNVPEQFAEARKLVHDDSISVEEAERKVLHATHGEVGAFLMGLWGLPDSIVEAIAYHSRPSEAPGNGFRPVAIVHAADVLSSEIAAGGSDTELDMAFLESIGKADRVDAWREACEEALLQEATS